MANSLAYLALFGWPAIVLVVFAVSRNPAKAAIATVFAGTLFLPARLTIDLAGLPPINKEAVTGLSALVAAIMFGRGAISFRGFTPMLIALLSVLLLSPVVTALLNSDPVLAGDRVIPGLRLYDALSEFVRQFIALSPFFVGFMLLHDSEKHRSIINSIFIFGLIYSIFILLEVRLSPQIHKWTYGFIQSSFLQQIRFGGYRPMVFMNHGLGVAFFAMMAVVAAAALSRDPGPDAAAQARKPLYGVLTAYLAVILVLCKSLASLVYGAFALPVMALLKPRLHIVAATGMAALCIAYPLLRSADLFPTDTITQAAENIDPKRARSLGFRFMNEDMLLDRASQRPFFGWGGWGRSRVYHEVTGRDLSATDGYWVIQIGSAGWAGFVAAFGLLCLPIFKMFLSRGKSNPPVATSALCLILGLNVVDLLPNSTLQPWTWMIVGALTAYAARPQTVSEPTVAARQSRLRVVIGGSPERQPLSGHAGSRTRSP